MEHRFGNRHVTLPNPRLGDQQSVCCRKPAMITMDFSMTSVGDHPTDSSTDPLATFTAYKQPSTVKLSPAPGKVTCTLTPSPQGAGM